eukprot:TRINITY_DN5031_c0_g1_i4.p1 TRINITY_DN5031_c0_g1~~TRINITY_DN5031_c0_g1_i4.p1  ORF type:complete len:629 (-),score=192.32 TRINITY_DN5031_c0_g1_i4:135-2021(-)
MEEPSEDFELEYVYGYRAGGSSMNCLYTENREIVYFAAAVGVVLDPATNAQRFFGGIGISSSMQGLIKQHSNKIMCMAIDSSRRYVATGQIGKYPSLFIWDAANCQLKTGSSMIILGDSKYSPKAITAVGFSAKGTYVSLTDGSDERRVYTYVVDTHEEKFMAGSQTGHVKAIAWERQNEEIFCTVGKSHVKFWYPFAANEKYLNCKMPSMSLSTDFFCAVFDNANICYTGGANGYIYAWNSEGNSFNQVQAHKGVVYALNYIAKDNQLISGGADGKVLIFSLPDFKIIMEQDFRSAVVSVDYLSEPERVLAGLADASIVEVEVEQENYHHILMQGHSDGFLTALDIFEENLVSAGEDNKIVVWNYLDCSPFITSIIDTNKEKEKFSGNQSRFPDNQRCKLLAINKVSGHIALALNNGYLQIREGCYMIDSTVYKTLVSEKHKITALKYSADGNRLAVATSDTHVYLYNSSSTYEYEKLGVIGGREGFVIDIDWSVDNSCFRGMTNDYYVWFFDAGDMRIHDDIEWTKKLEWDSGSVKLTWCTEGVYPKECDGEHIKAVAISNNKQLVASGDAANRMNLYRNPCRPGSKCKSFRGHASTVDCIIFAPNDFTIFSVAGPDRCIMQWKLK